MDAHNIEPIILSELLSYEPEVFYLAALEIAARILSEFMTRPARAASIICSLYILIAGSSLKLS